MLNLIQQPLSGDSVTATLKLHTEPVEVFAMGIRRNSACRVGFGAPMAGVPDNPAAQFNPSFPE